MGGRIGGKSIAEHSAGGLDHGERELLDYLRQEREARRRELERAARDFLRSEMKCRTLPPDRMPFAWEETYRKVAEWVLRAARNSETVQPPDFRRLLTFGSGRRMDALLGKARPEIKVNKDPHRFHSLHEEACVHVLAILWAEDRVLGRPATVSEMRTFDAALRAGGAVEITDQHHTSRSRTDAQKPRKRHSKIDGEVRDFFALNSGASERDALREVKRRLEMQGIERTERAIRQGLARERERRAGSVTP